MFLNVFTVSLCPTCLPITWRHGNPIFRSEQAGLQVPEFHFRCFAPAVESVRTRKPARNFTMCLHVTWGPVNQLLRSKEAGWHVLEFHFAMFCAGCRIGQESLTGLKHGAKCSSTSRPQNWISLVELEALFLTWLCTEHDHNDHFFDTYPNHNKWLLYTEKLIRLSDIGCY